MIIGTAGHIDHGKTVLIKALTGVNTDRLAEEQKRGISIDLGFAEFTLPSGRQAGIVDVPGHEAFIKNMLAGATGFDLALIVVAADDGVMPQTREHVDIINLLGVTRSVIAVTKTDLVDADMIELVEDDVQALIDDTPLKGSPIVAVSAVTGDGVPELLEILDSAAAEIEQKSTGGFFRLPVDRVFILKGAGTVVTGTLWSGEIKPDMNAEVLPVGLPARIRSIQVHSKQVMAAAAGNRVAVNLPGLDKTAIKRGDMLVTAGSIRPTFMFDAEFTVLADATKPLKNWTRVRVHHGTAEVMGRVVLLGGDVIEPGGHGYAQFRLEKPIVARRGDRFITRSYSPMVTIGGGEILFGHARRRKRHDQYTLALLDSALAGDTSYVLQLLLDKRGGPMAQEELALLTDCTDDELKVAIGTLLNDGRAFSVKGERLYYITVQALTALEEKVMEIVREYHESHPLETGIGKETLRSQLLRRLDGKAAGAMLAEMTRKGLINVTGDAVVGAGRSSVQGAGNGSMATVLDDDFKRAGLAPRPLLDLQEELQLTLKEIQTVISGLKKTGELIQVADGIYLHQAAVDGAATKARSFLEKNGRMTVAEFRDVVGTSRKFAVPLLEYFDKQKITKRDGDYRVLAG